MEGAGGRGHLSKAFLQQHASSNYTPFPSFLYLSTPSKYEAIVGLGQSPHGSTVPNLKPTGCQGAVLYSNHNTFERLWHTLWSVRWAGLWKMAHTSQSHESDGGGGPSFVGKVGTGQCLANWKQSRRLRRGSPGYGASGKKHKSALL